MPNEYRFKIDDFTPLTLPMGRLTEYLQELVKLFGNRDYVHLIRVEEGSAAPLMIVDDQAVPKVERRMLSVKTGSGPSEASRAFQSIDDKLAEDNTGARITSGSSGLTLVEFPGKNRLLTKPIRSVRETGTLDGEVIMIGGRDETISVHLRTGDQIYICTASRVQGRAIAKYLFDDHIRVYGVGAWTRSAEGFWKLESFTVDSFVPLRTEGLGLIVKELRSITSPDLTAVEDPIRFLSELNEVESGKEAE